MQLVTGLRRTDTKSLSIIDLLMALMTAATKHSSTIHHRSAHALLEDTVGDTKGNLLIKQGKGFELFQLRIKTGFTRGLGTAAITHLVPGEESESEAYKSDSGFTPMQYDSDPRLLSDSSQQVRVVAEAQRTSQITAMSRNITTAKLGRCAHAWENPQN